MQGRFTKTAPAAIELHLTLDLVAGTANYIELAPDKESEKYDRPYANDLKETLVLMVPGFFDINYCNEINEYKGFYLIRASNSINPNVLAYEIAGTNQVVDCHVDNEYGTRTRLKDIRSAKDSIVDYKVQWLKHSDATFRLIVFWDRKSRRKGYLITNLPAEQFNTLELLNLYGLRWQVELF